MSTTAIVLLAFSATFGVTSRLLFKRSDAVSSAPSEVARRMGGAQEPVGEYGDGELIFAIICFLVFFALLVAGICEAIP